jgi:hypothetical protein
MPFSLPGETIMTIHYNEMRRQSPEDDAEGQAPSRDKRGRFAGGRHNAKGRPKKEKPPTSLPEAFARALAEPVSVTIKGKAVKIAGFDALARKLVAQLYSGAPLDVARIYRLLEMAKAFDELKQQEAAKLAEASGNVWTEELDERYRILEGQYEMEDGTCCLCGCPPADADESSTSGTHGERGRSENAPRAR